MVLIYLFQFYLDKCHFGRVFTLRLTWVRISTFPSIVFTIIYQLVQVDLCGITE